jgi:hypothetical protein
MTAGADASAPPADLPKARRDWAPLAVVRP